MARKVILDCDPGIDDAVAAVLALFDPELEVVALTATAGNVPAEQTTRNVQTIVEQLDPPRLPRLGAATAGDHLASHHRRYLHGDDGLADAGFPCSELQHVHPSEKVICDQVRAAREQVTIVTLGPLTNLARALQRDPELPDLLHRVVIVGGAVNGIGDVTPAAEFNMFYDPISAQTVFRSKAPKTIIPLDVVRQVPFTLDLLDQLPSETTRAGRFLRRIVPYMFRAHRQHLGLETVYLSAVIGLLAVTQGSLFEVREMAGEVETHGEVTTGATVFDRRRHFMQRSNLEVAVQVDGAAAADCVVRSLAQLGRATAD